MHRQTTRWFATTCDHHSRGTKAVNNGNRSATAEVPGIHGHDQGTVPRQIPCPPGRWISLQSMRRLGFVACLIGLGLAAPVPAVASTPESAVAVSLSFENDIIPILTRFGCNTSGCHGKAEGQNGFKLSVFGFDPVAD